MDRLTEIIGPAPSEMTEENFAKRLSAERARVSEALTAMKEGFFQRSSRKKPVAKKKQTLATKAMKLLESQGLSIEELEEILGEEKK